MDFANLASKLVGFVIEPGNFLILILLIGTLFAWLRPRRSGRIWLTVLTAVLVFVTVAPVYDWIARPLEDRFPPPAVPPAKVDGILVLGGVFQYPVAARRGVLAVSDSAERFMVPAALAHRYPEARLVISGLGEDHPVVRDWFAQIGVAPDRIAFEPAARNTFENALFSWRMLQPGPDEVWLLVTSAQHMPRSVGVFRKVGWPVIPYPVDYRADRRWNWRHWPDPAANLADIGVAVKEWVGLLGYYLLGRSDELWPAPSAP